MELFDKKFVHIVWDCELIGKVCFVANNMKDLIFAVENDGKGAVKTNALRYSGNNVRPFHAYMLGANCSYPFAYYDPNYAVKKAFNEGKKIQCYVGDGWIPATAPNWDADTKYRVKPEEGEGLKWTDLKVGDIIRAKDGSETALVVRICNDAPDGHINIGYWLRDTDLEKYWEKKED